MRPFFSRRDWCFSFLNQMSLSVSHTGQLLAGSATPTRHSEPARSFQKGDPEQDQALCAPLFPCVPFINLFFLPKRCTEGWQGATHCVRYWRCGHKEDRCQPRPTSRSFLARRIAQSIINKSLQLQVLCRRITGWWGSKWRHLTLHWGRPWESEVEVWTQAERMPVERQTKKEEGSPCYPVGLFTPSVSQPSTTVPTWHLGLLTPHWPCPMPCGADSSTAQAWTLASVPVCIWPWPGSFSILLLQYWCWPTLQG